MAHVKSVRGADVSGRILTSEIYAGPRPKMIRPPRRVFFKCPEPSCGYEHAQWSMVGQHLFHHHGYSQDTIDLEECEQRKNRRNKNWLKKKLPAMEVSETFIDEDGNELEEEENRENDMKPSPIVLEARRKLLPRYLPKEGCICPISECSDILPTRVDLVKHARAVHLHHPTAVGNFDIRTELFENEDDFKDWKARLESDFGMYYACESTGRQGDCKNYFFVCHRSGRVVRRMRQLRERRLADRIAAAEATNNPLPSPKKRNKIVKNQEYCTAFMRARRDQLGRIHVAYSTSHIGHDQDASMLPLTPPMKKLIYDRIVAEHHNSSMSLIASRIRDEYNDESSRLHYVSMADVIEVVRMERKRLAQVGGAEADNALDIFKNTLKKGRRKMGEELLSNGERHKPPRHGGVGLGGRRREREEMEMDSKANLLDFSHPIKLDDDDDDDDEDIDMMEDVEEDGVMDDHHAVYYDDVEVDDEGVHGHATFVDEEGVDNSMLETGSQQEEEEEDEIPHLVPSSSRVVDRSVQRGRQPQQSQVVMEEAVSNKHKLDVHHDNICEALVRSGDAVALQSYLDAIRSVSSRYEHLLRR